MVRNRQPTRDKLENYITMNELHTEGLRDPKITETSFYYAKL